MAPPRLSGALFLASGLLCFLNINACSSISVMRYDPAGTKEPQGIPFYLTKPMKKVTTTKYEFRQLPGAEKVLWKTEFEVLEVINVVDTSKMFTINKPKAFAGETKFEFHRTVPAVAGVGDASSTDLSIVKSEDKEGITEFLKGLVEGAKSVVEAAKTAKEAGGFGIMSLAGTPEKEAEFIEALFGRNILVVKSVSITLDPI